MIARFNLDLAWASAITFRAVRAACAHLANVALGTLGPRNERSEKHSLNTSSEGTTPSGPNISLHDLTVKLNTNSFFNIE